MGCDTSSQTQNQHDITNTTDVKERQTPTPIVFVLGKPGSGKGTVCSELEKHQKIQFFSAGDLLRNEVQQHKDSAEAVEILEDMKAGRIVRPQITVALLKRAMHEHPEAQLFMIDGFPRELGQLEFFKQQIDVERCWMLHIQCPDETCLQRIKGRNQGRVDDNDETIKARFANFAQETLKVIDLFGQKGKLMEVDAGQTKELSCQAATAALKSHNLIK